MPPLYRRIHIQDPSQYPLLYQLLESYIIAPETAASVKEVIFRPASISKRSSCHWHPKPDVEEWLDAEAARSAPQNSPIYQGIDRLGLPPEEEKEWAKIVTWMAPELRDKREPPNQDPGVKEYFDKFVRENDYKFVTHASALLLMLCPNIERFVYGDNEDRNPVKMTLRKNNYGALPQTHLQNLKEVMLLSTDDFLFGDERFYVRVDILELMRMFHRLPNITSISAEAMDSPREEYQDTFPAGVSTIKRINITHSIFGSEVLAAMIRSPIALEELTITTGGRSTIDGSSGMCGEEIGKALGCQKESLIKLDLDLGFVHEPWHNEEGEEDEFDPYESGLYQVDEWRLLELEEAKIDEKEGLSSLRAMQLPGDRSYGTSIGSLHDFERLTHLSINIQHLLGHVYHRYLYSQPEALPKLVDALPPNLEYLLLRGYKKGAQQELDDHIAEVLKLRSKKFPALKEIHGIDNHIPEGEDVERPDENYDLLYKVEEVDPSWHLHTHDEL